MSEEGQIGVHSDSHHDEQPPQHQDTNGNNPLNQKDPDDEENHQIPQIPYYVRILMDEVAELKREKAQREQAEQERSEKEKTEKEKPASGVSRNEKCKERNGGNDEASPVEEEVNGFENDHRATGSEATLVQTKKPKTLEWQVKLEKILRAHRNL